MITGTIEPIESISGKIENHGEIIGIVNENSNISGEVNSEKQMTGSISLFGDLEPTRYSGDHEFTSSTDADYSVDTKFKFMSDDIVVKKIPYYETSNPTGTTIYIGD